MDTKINFNSHIEFIKKKSLAALSFVERPCRHSKALVRSNLEFANIIWDLYTEERRNAIESVHTQAVLYIHSH